MEIISIHYSTVPLFWRENYVQRVFCFDRHFSVHILVFPDNSNTIHLQSLICGLFQFSHARNQGSPGERQRGSGGPPGRNRETQLQPEPGPDQYQPHPQWPGLSWREVRRHLCPAVPQHPPVTVPAADQCQLHTGTKLNETHSDLQIICYGQQRKHSSCTKCKVKMSTKEIWIKDCWILIIYHCICLSVFLVCLYFSFPKWMFRWRRWKMYWEQTSALSSTGWAFIILILSC